MTGSEPRVDVADRIATVLACLAIDPRLGGVLFIDLPPAMLEQCARWMGSVIAESGAGTPRIEALGSHDWDETLWWRPAMPTADGSFVVEHRHGPVVDARLGENHIVIIPDLATASLAVKRAAVTLIGTDEAAAERHGRQYIWRPASRWLAACRHDDLPRLSAHLLDRFAVRVDTTGLVPLRPQAWQVRAALDSPGTEGEIYLPLPPSPVIAGRDRAMPTFTAKAADLVVRLLGAKSAGIRRELALARTGRALAMIGGADEVTQAHILAAATIGVSPSEAESPAALSTSDDAVQTAGQQPISVSQGDVELGPSFEAGTDEAHRIEQSAAELETVLVHQDTAGQMWLYPEDSPSALPEHASLRVPWQRSASIRRGRGVVIGSESTAAMEDLAVVATVTQAAKFQPLRRRALPSGPSLLIGQSDLRRFRRQGQPDTAVVLVLDHSCRGTWNLGKALQPYLHWAYVQRAAISIVEFGHATNPNQLRAERYRAVGVSGGPLAERLHRSPGHASPLAYALDMAMQELRRQTRQGQVRAGNCWLVVASDARGNVPLETSLRGKATQPTGREGIDDALEVARKIGSLAGVHAVVLAPPDIAYYARLPFDLADAMGGIVADTEARQ